MKAFDQLRGLMAWYRAYKTTRRILAVMGVALLAAACGGDNSDEPTGPGTSGNPKLRIENRSEHSAWYVYTRECGGTEWSSDHLGAHIIQINHAVTFSMEPGCKDVKAETSIEFGGTQLWPGRTFVASQTDTLRLDEWEYTP